MSLKAGPAKWTHRIHTQSHLKSINDQIGQQWFILHLTKDYTMSLLPLTPSLRPFLEGYLPKPCSDRPFLTLTYAQSLDSRIAAKVGEQTKISHLETKTMTHYIRSKHDGILVGIGTVEADDPKLNCRFEDENGQISNPRPVVLDPHGKWKYHESQLCGICDSKKGLAPFILVDNSAVTSDEDSKVLEKQGGAFVKLPLCNKPNRAENWDIILRKLFELGIKSIMVEGGASIINDLLAYNQVVDSLIITVGPVFLGKEGVEVSPSVHADLVDVKWWQGVQDSVLCARLT